MLEIMELYQALNKATDSESCFYRYMEYVKQFGLTSGMLISAPHGVREFAEDINYVSTYDPHYFQDYLSLGGLKSDLSAQLLLALSQDIFHFSVNADTKNAPIILGRPVTKEERMSEELGLDYGINTGFAVTLERNAGMPVKGMGISAIGMSAHEYLHEVIANDRAISQANYLLGLSLKRFYYKDLSIKKHDSFPTLTRRQRDLVLWLAEGYRLQDIADNKIYRSIHTINKELHEIKRQLQATTNEEIVAKGIVLGLVN